VSISDKLNQQKKNFPETSTFNTICCNFLAYAVISCMFNVNTTIKMEKNVVIKVIKMNDNYSHSRFEINGQVSHRYYTRDWRN